MGVALTIAGTEISSPLTAEVGSGTEQRLNPWGAQWQRCTDSEGMTDTRAPKVCLWLEPIDRAEVTACRSAVVARTSEEAEVALPLRIELRHGCMHVFGLELCLV